MGNVDGQIAVFKGTAAQTVADDTLPSRSQRPWWTCRGLGSIAVVVVGDLMHTGLNATVGISAEGACHVFEESTARRRRLSDNTPSASALPSASPSVDASTDGSFGETTSVESRMVLAHTLSIPVNIKVHRASGSLRLVHDQSHRRRLLSRVLTQPLETSCLWGAQTALCMHFASNARAA